MAVSGSKNFSITRTDIIESALRKLGAYDIGESPSSDETDAASMALNLMVKAWAAKDVGLWLNEEVTLFLQKDTQSYTLGTSGDAEATLSYVETTLSAAEASGQTVLSVTSSAGMTAADRVGIKMDDGSTHWTTIVSVDSAVQITITTATDDDAASGNRVYAYTTKAQRPQKLKFAYRRDSSDLDTTVDLIGENEYHNLSNKGADGPVTQIWYKPILDTGKLYVWPVDGDCDKLILGSRVLPDDFDASSDNPQFPIEWGEALVYGLSDRMAPEYGLSERERRMIKLEAEFKLEEMLDYNVENADVVFALE